VMPFPAMSFGDRFCVCKKGGTGRWVGSPTRWKTCLGLAVERP